ncbi:protein kinase domain-containing protein, partial [Nocardia brasiliensis]
MNIALLPQDLEVVEVLGQGCLTMVLRCRHRTKPGEAVVKCPAPGLADPSLAAEALHTEAEIRGAIVHPAILPLEAVHDTPNGPYLVGPYFPDGSLATALATPLPWDVALEVVDRVAEAVDALHRAGWVHHDLVASNILCEWSSRRFLLADFGAARPVGSFPEPRRQRPAGAASPPENLRTEPAHPSADIFALSRLADRCLPAGRPADVATVLRNGTRTSFRERPATAVDLARDLRDASAHELSTRAAQPTFLPQSTPLADSSDRLATFAAGLPVCEQDALHELLRRAEVSTARALRALGAVTVDVFGRAEALALFEDLGLAHALAEGCTTASELAATIRLAVEPTRTLLDLMTTTGLVTRRAPDGTARNTVEYGLAPTIAPLYALDRKRLSRPIAQARDSWAELSVWLQTASATAPMDADNAGSGYRDAAMLMGAASHNDAQDLAAALRDDPGITAARWIVDIGAGSGVWSQAVLQTAAPHASVVLIDRQEVLMAGRTTTPQRSHHRVAADWRALPLADGVFDLAVLANVCHVEDETNAEQLIHATKNLLRPGGTMLIVDTIGTDLDVGALLQSMHLGIRTRHGRVHSRQFYLHACAKTGLNLQREHRLPSGLTAMICVRNP